MGDTNLTENLKDKIGYDAKREDLGILLKEPFNIDASGDFPLIYVACYNDREGKKGTVNCIEGLSEGQNDRLWSGVHYDYTFPDKIFMSHLYHKFTKAGLSESNLEDVRNVIDGKIYSVQGLYGIIDNVPIDIAGKIWPELLEHPGLEKNYIESLKNLRESPQRELVDSILEEEQDYLYDLSCDFARGNPDDTRHDSNLNYVPAHIPLDKWKEISIFSVHSIGNSINWLHNSLGRSRK